jgi:hypothetical protein
MGAQVPLVLRARSYPALHHHPPSSPPPPLPLRRALLRHLRPHPPPPRARRPTPPSWRRRVLHMYTSESKSCRGSAAHMHSSKLRVRCSHLMLTSGSSSSGGGSNSSSKERTGSSKVCRLMVLLKAFSQARASPFSGTTFYVHAHARTRMDARVCTRVGLLSLACSSRPLVAFPLGFSMHMRASG